MSQERMQSGGDSGRSFDAPDIGESLQAASSVTQKVRVVHGVNEGYFDNLEGKTVGSVKKSLREVYNIPGDAEALVEGKAVQDDFILEGGQNLEFVKEAGVKGFDNSRALIKMRREWIRLKQEALHQAKLKILAENPVGLMMPVPEKK